MQNLFHVCERAAREIASKMDLCTVRSVQPVLQQSRLDIFHPEALLSGFGIEYISV